jgi:hypothetical protein
LDIHDLNGSGSQDRWGTSKLPNFHTVRAFKCG